MKKNKNLPLIIGSIIFLLVIAGLIIFISFPLETVVPPEGIDYTTQQLISQDEEGATYRFYFDSYPSSSGDCSSELSSTYSFRVETTQSMSSRANFVEGLQEGVEVEAISSSVSRILGAINPCSGSIGIAEATLTNKKAVCTIVKDVNVRGNKSNIECLFTGDVHVESGGEIVPANFYGVTEGEALIKFPFEGVDPPTPPTIPNLTIPIIGGLILIGTIVVVIVVIRIAKGGKRK